MDDDVRDEEADDRELEQGLELSQGRARIDGPGEAERGPADVGPARERQRPRHQAADPGDRVHAGEHDAAPPAQRAETRDIHRLLDRHEGDEDEQRQQRPAEAQEDERDPAGQAHRDQGTQHRSHGRRHQPNRQGPACLRRRRSAVGGENGSPEDRCCGHCGGVSRAGDRCRGSVPSRGDRFSGHHRRPGPADKGSAVVDRSSVEPCDATVLEPVMRNSPSMPC